MEEIKKEKKNPIITLKAAEVRKRLAAIKEWKYADNWVPDKKDIIFTNIIGAIIAPVRAYYQCQNDQNTTSLDYFVTSPKKCYNSDLMRDHTCHYLNYFEYYYDEDKEYLAILCQMKYVIDNGVLDKDGNRVFYDEVAFLNDLRRYVLNPSLVEKVVRMCRDNYCINLNYKNINNPSLQYNDEHARVLFECSVLINMMIPLLTHFAYVNKINKKIDDFLLRAFDMAFNTFTHVDIYAKLYETCRTNISKNEQSNAGIWAKQDIRGRNGTTHTLSSLNNIILNIIPKYVFSQNIISMNYSSIINNTGFQITDISFEYSFVQLSSSKRDEDNQSDIDKYEANLIKQDESKYIEVQVNARTTMDKIDKLFGPFDQADIDYYFKIFGNDEYRDKFQKELIFLTFYKYFGDTTSINSINQLDYFKLMLAAKKIYLSNNMLILPYLISGKVEKLVGRKSVNKKELLKVKASPIYKAVEDKYRNEKIMQIILGYVATAISSEFRIIERSNSFIDGQIIDIVPDIIIEEMLNFALMV
jgi:hypothetical protein